MNKIIKIFILYCLPILTIQSCGKQCNSKPVSDSETNSNSQNPVSNSETNSNSQNVSQTQQPISSITEAMCKKTKDFILGYNNHLLTTFFEQTIQEIRNGNPAAVNNKNAGDYDLTLLGYAINSDNEELFEELLKLSPDLAQKDANGSTILIVAIGARKVNFVATILKQPKLEEFINEPDSQNRTPLDYAEYYELLYTIANDHQKKSDFADIIKALQAKKAKRAV